MTNATMPEPVAWRIRFAVSGDFDQIDYHSHNAIGDYRAIYPDATSTPLITTDQAEAYAAAKVREALEEAALFCEGLHRQFSEEDARRFMHQLRGKIYADAIRALTQPTKESEP